MMKPTLTQIFFLAAIVVVSLFVGFGRGWATNDDERPENSQVLKFSHSKHINDLGVECASCHEPIMKSTSAKEIFLPSHDQCQTCHEEKINDECSFCHVNGDDPQPLKRRISELQFNHKFHLEDQQLECVTCHQGLEKVEYANASNFPAMATCSQCHNNVKAENQCAVCHSNVNALRPASHELATFTKEHGKLVRLRTMDAQCQSCHSSNFCEQCHDGTNLTHLHSKEAMGLISPRTEGNENGLVLKGQMVHDLNFKFTHGIQAKGKAYDCQTCHRDQQFCSDCHMEGSAAFGGARPTSHEQTGFATLGVGSGGGVHATMAKRDINACISCHDTEGSDPTCITCHVDPDGVKVTNPRTHKAGFMKDVEGYWHEDRGANCYTCHTDPNARTNGKSGMGFCGYCHGVK